MIEYIYCCLLFVSFCFRFTSTNLHDDTLQHVCLTWENTQGVTKLYKDVQITEQVTNDATKNDVLKAGGALELGQDLLAEDLIVCKLFMADWQVSTCKIKFCPKATLPLSTQIVAYPMVLFLTGLYTKILLMAMSQLKSCEPHWSVIETLAEPKFISRMM